MSKDNESPAISPKDRLKAEKAARLASALRDNLKRRKAQAKSRAEGSSQDIITEADVKGIKSGHDSNCRLSQDPGSGPPLKPDESGEP